MEGVEASGGNERQHRAEALAGESRRRRRRVARTEASGQMGEAVTGSRHGAGGLPGSPDPGLAGDEDEADSVGKNRRRDVLGKKTIGAMVRFRSEMGVDRSGMEVGSSATEEANSPWLAAAGSDVLRPRRI
ncbi:hypothetical protein ACLOJK_038624 [Asimina triloba]